MAGPQQYVFSAATLSWIDPAAKLPEYDRGGAPDPILTFGGVTQTPNCRFGHLLGCSILVDNGKIIDRSILPVSGLYERKSFLGTNPQDYTTRRDATVWSSEQATFVQTVGCRTQAPEVIGGRVGAETGEGVADGLFPVLAPIVGPIGRRIGREIGKDTAEYASAFPPIWTTLTVYMHASGLCSATVKVHSLFPSMTFYTTRQASQPPRMFTSLVWHQQERPYDGVPHYHEWLKNGWGKGNPWLVNHP
jgi:hypothetical protein